MTVETVPLAPNASLDQMVAGRARRHISRGVYISNRHRVNGKDYFEFGVSTPRFIFEPARRPLLKYVCIDGVFSVSVVRNGDRVQIEWPSNRNDVAEKLESKRNGLIRRAENALVESISDDLIRIPKVQTGINPIKEILIALVYLGEIQESELSTRIRKGRAGDYLKFLEDLGFISRKDGVVFPGNEITKYDLAKIDRAEVPHALLSEVLKRGTRYIKERLQIQILTPYLEFTNAYYLNSHFADHLLRLDREEIHRQYLEMYPRARKKQPYQVHANLQEISAVGILQHDGGLFMGNEELFSHFQNRMARAVV